MNYKREKGKLYYYDDLSDKTAWYDINEGKFANDSRQYAGLPPFINNNPFRKRGSLRGEWDLPMEQYLFLLAAKNADLDKTDRNNSVMVCKLLDRLLNVLPADCTPTVRIYAMLDDNIIDLALRNKTFFTYLAKYIRDNYTDVHTLGHYLERAYHNYDIRNLTICDNDYYGAECLQKTYVVSSFYNLAKEYHEIIDFNTICYYLTHGLYDKWAYRWRSSQTHHDMERDLSYLLSMCLEMNYCPPKDKWMVVDLAVRKMYYQFLDNKDKEPFNLNPALAYHNDKFTVIIPNNAFDCRQEADHQQNCVYSMYVPKVLRKETQVVFVRRNDGLENSYITCEVRMNGTIAQYLLANNRPVKSDTPEWEFRVEYQNYLNKVFGRE